VIISLLGNLVGRSKDTRLQTSEEAAHRSESETEGLSEGPGKNIDEDYRPRPWQLGRPYRGTLLVWLA
jgi:hypothetical protein